MPDWVVEKSHSGLPSSGQPLRIRPQAVFFLRLAVNGVLFLLPICDNVGDGLVSLFGSSLGLNGVWPCF